MKLTRRHLASLLLVIVIAADSCGGSSLLKSFRVALTASGPLVNALVNSGAIDQTKATAIIADFNAAAQCGLILQEMFSAIPKDALPGEIKSRKFQASLNALQCFRVIVQRQNFAANPRIQTVANIAEGILASLVAFYSDGTSHAVATAPNLTIARDEKDLEEKLKAKVKELEQAMTP